MTISALAVALVVATGLTSAGFDLYQKLLAERLTPVQMVFWLGLASIPLFAIGVFFRGWPAIETGYWWPAVISILLNLGGHIAFVEAVKVSDLSKTVPLLSLTPVFTSVLGVWLLGERLDTPAIIGVVLVVVGVFWLHTARGAGPSGGGWFQLFRDRGAWLMIGTAVAWSITIPLDKLAVARSEAFFHGLVLTAGMTLGAFVLLLRSRERVWRPIVRWRIFVMALLLCVGTLLFQLLALTQTLAGIVETGKRSIANVMALVFGRVAFREEINRGKLIAVALMVVGVALILVRPS